MKNLFSAEDIKQAAAADRLLSLEIESISSGECLTVDEWKDVLMQAAELGAQEIVFSGGEPLTGLPEIARSLGMTAEISPSKDCQPGKECFRFLYSCVLRSTGDVIPCTGFDVKLGNVRENSLKDILSGSQVRFHLKNYRKYIKGPCAVCEKADHCCGCRGIAYQITGDYLSSDPECPCNRDKQDRIPRLPQKSDGMLPHARPMLFVGELVRLADRTGSTKSVVQPDNPFLSADGRLAREALIEYAAQTAALMDSQEKDGRVSPGLLIEVKDFVFTGDAGVGDTIEVTLTKEFDMGIWHGIFIRITVNGAPAAQGELKLCIFESSVPQ